MVTSVPSGLARAGADGVVTGAGLRVGAGAAYGNGRRVWGRGATPRTGEHRFELLEFNGIVEIAGVQIRPGDLMLGDSDGVIVVPLSIAAEVLARAEEVAAKEKTLIDAISTGASAAETAAIVAPEKW